MYCQHLPTHWWTNHSELAYLIRDPSPTTPRELFKEEAVEKMDDATRIETWPTLKKKQHWMFGKVLGKTIEY